MPNKQSNHAPVGACQFVRPVEAFGEGEGESGKFRIVAYSGEIITGHWYWGNIAFDLAGQKFAKAKTPILTEHMLDRHVGFTTSQEIGEKIVVEGNYLSNEWAQGIKQDIAEGYPMQASVHNEPEVVEHVEAGASVEVNGHTLSGPGTVFRKATIHEISMCTLGADSNTESVAATGETKDIQFEVINTKEHEMSGKEKETKEPTVEQFLAALEAGKFSRAEGVILADAPALAGVRAAGAKDVTEQFGVFCEKFGDCPAFVIEQFAKGASLIEATDAFADKMKGERDAAVASAEEAKKAGTGVAAAGKVDPAVQEFSDSQAEAADQTDGLDGAEKYEAEFKDDPNVRKEFRNKIEDYKAFRRAEDKDLIGIHGGSS